MSKQCRKYVVFLNCNNVGSPRRFDVLVGAHGGRSGHLVLFLVALSFSKFPTIWESSVAFFLQRMFFVICFSIIYLIGLTEERSVNLQILSSLKGSYPN